MIIICSECGKEYSDQAKQCPHCGAITAQNRYISNNKKGKNSYSYQNNINGSNGGGFGAIITLIVLLVLFWICLKVFLGLLSMIGLDIDGLKSTFDKAWDSSSSFWDDDTSSSSSISSSKGVYNIGEIITTDKFEITITEVEERTEVGTSASASEGNIFICVRAKIKNITGAKIGIVSQPYFCLVDGKDIDYYSGTLASLQYAMEKGTGNQPELNSGVTIYDDMVFEINKNYYTQNTFNLEIWADKVISVKIK